MWPFLEQRFYIFNRYRDNRMSLNFLKREIGCQIGHKEASPVLSKNNLLFCVAELPKVNKKCQEKLRG
jgi:hypothetical protein